MKKRTLYLMLGPTLFLLCAFALPQTVFTTFESRAAIGTMVWTAFWWITAPVDYAVTGLLPIAINALVPMAPMDSVIANYASETIMLLLGADIITISWEATGLDKRIAARFLGMIGDNFRQQVLFWFILSAVLSAILPNAIVCATLTAIAIAMLNYIGHGDIGNSRIGSKLVLTIAYAAGLGGIATPLGGAMNLVVVDYIQQVTGQEYIYTSWVIRLLPITLALVIINGLFLIRDVKKDESLGGSKEYFLQEAKKMPPMSLAEKCSLLLFVIATILAFTRQLYQAYLPGLKPAYAFIICAIISFLITTDGGDRLMLWKSVQTKVIWEMLYIFGGGLAIGTIVSKSGAAQAIGDLVGTLGLDGGLFTVFIIVTVTVLMSDVTSATATAAITIPIVISVINGIGLNPIPYIYIATIGINVSYMLPTSIRAIPVGYGLKPKYMLSEGVKITVWIIACMTALSYMLLKYWPAFSTV